MTEKLRYKGMTEPEYIVKLAKARPNTVLISGYVDAYTKAKHECACGHAFDISPLCTLMNPIMGCIKCRSGKKGRPRLADDEFAARLSRVLPNLVMASTYVDKSTRVKVRCVLCDAVMSRLPGSLIRNKTCRCNCNRKAKI